MTISKAEKELTDKGFIVNEKIETIASDTIKKNRVVKTEPPAGSLRVKGTKITIYKSTGVKTYTLKNYVEQNYKESVNELESYGIKVTTDKKDPEAETCKYIGKDVIIEQSLAEGSKIKSGDAITFKILNTVEFPDFSGKTKDEITNWANNNCVKVNVSFQETMDKNQIDKVISQTRPKGSTVTNNDTIGIVVGKKSEVVETKVCVSTTDSTKTKTVEVGKSCPEGYKEKGTNTQEDNKKDEKKTN